MALIADIEADKRLDHAVPEFTMRGQSYLLGREIYGYLGEEKSARLLPIMASLHTTPAPQAQEPITDMHLHAPWRDPAAERKAAGLKSLADKNLKVRRLVREEHRCQCRIEQVARHAAELRFAHLLESDAYIDLRGMVDVAACDSAVIAQPKAHGAEINFQPAAHLKCVFRQLSADDGKWRAISERSKRSSGRIAPRPLPSHRNVR